MSTGKEANLSEDGPSSSLVVNPVEMEKYEHAGSQRNQVDAGSSHTLPYQSIARIAFSFNILLLFGMTCMGIFFGFSFHSDAV